LSAHIVGALRRLALLVSPSSALDLIRRRVAGSAADTAALHAAGQLRRVVHCGGAERHAHIVP
jgi:hypothetical protein